MPFTHDQFIKTRPWLYHLTDTRNAERILSQKQMHPASALLYAAGRPDLLSVRRRESEIITFDGQQVHIRDQQPLHAGNALLEGGWSFGRLVEELNHRVFFWPGNETAPISYEINHFKRYKCHPCSVLAILTEALFVSNSTITPDFCRYNSGSPRCRTSHHGLGSPRGPHTFVPADRFEGTPGAVVEVTFRHAVSLPARDIVVRPVTDFA